MLLFLWFKAINAAIILVHAVSAAFFPVQRCQRRYFSGCVLPTPLIFWFNNIKAAIFRFTCLITTIFPAERRWLRYFSGSTPLTPQLFLFNAVNAAISPNQRCQRRYFAIQRL